VGKCVCGCDRRVHDQSRCIAATLVHSLSCSRPHSRMCVHVCVYYVHIYISDISISLYCTTAQQQGSEPSIFSADPLHLCCSLLCVLTRFCSSSSLHSPPSPLIIFNGAFLPAGGAPHSPASLVSRLWPLGPCVVALSKIDVLLFSTSTSTIIDDDELIIRSVVVQSSGVFLRGSARRALCKSVNYRVYFFILIL